MSLDKEQIKSIVRRERQEAKGSFKDQTDMMLDRAFELYENKELNEDVLKALVANIVLNATQETILDLRKDFIKKSLNIYGNDSNKVFLLNYSKKSYA